MKKKLSILLLLAATLSVSAQNVQHSVLSQGHWWKLGIKESGVYRITTADVPQLAGRPVDSIALYGGDGLMLAESNAATPIEGLQPVAVDIDDRNGNGIFDSGDGLLFYGEGCDAWRYHSGDQRFELRRHAYSNLNYYFITTNAPATPLRIATQPLPDGECDVVNTYTAVAYHNNDLVNIYKTGQVWLGEKYTNSVPNRNVSLGLPSAPVSGTNLKCRYALASVSSTTSTFTVACNSEMVISTIEPSSKYRTVLEEFAPNNTARADFAITYGYREPTATGYLDYIEVNAEVPLNYAGSQMFIRTSKVDGERPAKFKIAGAPSSLRVWRTDGVTVELEVVSDGTGTWFADSVDSPATYIAFNGSVHLSPTSVSVVDNQDLTGCAAAQYVVVANPMFWEQAGQIASLHAINDGLSTLIVTPEQVFNEFSSGKQDPIAIRSLLRNMTRRDSAERPRYLLLFGKGTYDHRNLLGLQIPSVVTYESAYSFDDEGTSYCSDDMFGYLDLNEFGSTSEKIDVAIGRLPAKSVDEANHLVDKIIGYVNKRDLSADNCRGDWRNYITMLADDADPGSAGDTSFAHSSEHTSRLIKALYPHLNIDKIYADSYVQSSGAIGSYYPDVDNALKRRMDYGCLLINYIGHGSSSYIGTERFIELDDISNYANTDKLSFLVTSTCTFGRFDQPDDISGAEAFMLAQGGGIAVVSATRKIGHSESFNTDVCLSSLNPANTIGEALRYSKNRTAVSHSISLLGDPALKLSFPTNNVVVTHINDSAVSDTGNDSAMVLSRVKISGEIRNADGELESDFDGVIYPIVFDREMRTHTLANDNPGTELYFTQQKSILYKGIDSVRGGRFEYSFIVPRDVAYQYAYGKLSHYARSGNSDAAGQYSRLMFGGLDQSADIGETRPSIRLFINDTTFRDGGITDENPSIYALLFDSVGINAVGSGLGHDITATLDGNGNSVMVLNDFYETDLADSRGGTINYQLKDIAPGRHTIELKAWNIFNYSNSASISFIVRSSDTAVAVSPSCYPNPSSESTTFSLQINCPKQVTRIQLQIFDIFGQSVSDFELEPDPDSYVVGPVTWNYTTHNGSKVPNGIYVARFLITTDDGEILTANTKCVKK